MLFSCASLALRNGFRHIGCLSILKSPEHPQCPEKKEKKITFIDTNIINITNYLFCCRDPAAAGGHAAGLVRGAVPLVDIVHLAVQYSQYSYVATTYVATDGLYHGTVYT